MAKIVTYVCDQCGKLDMYPMAVFLANERLEWLMSGNTEKADFHLCSRECGKLFAARPEAERKPWPVAGMLLKAVGG